jgi:uncharacterized protein DUF3606
MTGLTHKLQPDRGKINLQDRTELQCWLKHFGVAQDDLQRAVDKVGNSAAAGREELAG